MSADTLLFDYEEALRSGGAPTPEVFTKALKGVLEQQSKRESEMLAALDEIKQSLVAIHRKMDDASVGFDRQFTAAGHQIAAVGQRIDTLEIKLSGDIKLARAEVSADIMKAMNNQVWRATGIPIGILGGLIGLIYFVEKFTS